jgi:hypothetical protein
MGNPPCMVVRVCSVLSLLSLTVACAPNTPPEAPAPVAPGPTAAPVVAKPRCAASEPNSPADVKPVMRQGGGDVKGCFMMGKATTAPPSLAVSMTISQDGSARITSINATGAEREQIACAESAIRKLHFARFCGDDVVVQWTYALAQ